MTRKLELFYGNLTMKTNQILNILIILKQFGRFGDAGTARQLLQMPTCPLEGTTQSHMADIFFVEMKYFI